MKRVLFVDDEPNVLQGLQRMLRSQRFGCEMSFAPGGEAALTLMEATRFDVIVSDMRMPHLDGAALLALVRERYPEVIRVVLSGHADMDSAFRAVPVAHLFLAKPCDPTTLRVAIERSCGLKAVLSDEPLRRAVGSVRELPALPRTYVELTRALAGEDVPLAQVAKIVEDDVAVAAKILQLVNSAFFGLSRNVTNIQTAVSYLGVEVLRNLVLSIGVFGSFSDKPLAAGFSLSAFEDHAHLTAKIATSLPTAKYLGDAAGLAALLHDLGKLILASQMPKHLESAMVQARRQRRPLHEIEYELLGVSHAEVGAYLLGLWGLPWTVVEAVAHHHAPHRVPSQGLDVLAAVHIADALALECLPPHSDIPLVQPPLDVRYLDMLGVTDRLPEWREMAKEISLRFEDYDGR
ncbi:MAG: HDOD domain-containing protein [Acidobacteriota bacterium]|nr:HDOD domain-containing protein [Acidobacteriota bacterium]